MSNKEKSRYIQDLTKLVKANYGNKKVVEFYLKELAKTIDNKN